MVSGYVAVVFRVGIPPGAESHARHFTSSPVGWSSPLFVGLLFWKGWHRGQRCHASQRSALRHVVLLIGVGLLVRRVPLCSAEQLVFTHGVGVGEGSSLGMGRLVVPCQDLTPIIPGA